MKNVSDLAQYKVCEFDSGIIIIGARDHLQRPGVINLIIADLPTCGEYLARYCYERVHGKDPKAAHAEALKGARVIAKGHLDQAAPGPVGHG